MAKKLNYNKSGARAARRLRRWEEAEARQEAHDARTLEQQLALIATRRGESKQESERLQARLELLRAAGIADS